MPPRALDRVQPCVSRSRYVDQHLQHTILLLISPISFNNWTSTVWSLNRNARSNLVVTPFAPSFASPNVVEGTYGLELRRRQYVSVTEVTRISAICFKCIIFVRTRKNNSKHTTTQHSEQKPKSWKTTGFRPNQKLSNWASHLSGLGPSFMKIWTYGSSPRSGSQNA